jgi:hypothetical protein
VTAFLDKDVVVDVDKVTIEIPSNTEETKASGVPAVLDAKQTDDKSKADAKTEANANDDIMKSLGGGGDKKP